MKNIDFIKICNNLDEQGKYKSSDNIEKLIKISQGLYGQMEDPVPLPSRFRTTNMPYTGNKLIDSLTDINNISDSAMGREYADGRMYDITAPYEGTGPDSPFIAPYQPTPTEQRDMDPDVLLGLTQENAQQAANYIRGISEPEAQQKALQEILLSRGGDQNIKNSLFENSLSTLGANFARTLMSRPLNSWEGIVNEFMRSTRRLPPDKAAKQQDLMKKALNDVVRNSKLDPKFKQNLTNSPTAQRLLRTYGIVV